MNGSGAEVNKAVHQVRASGDVVFAAVELVDE
jgi:hypothetical protein